MKPNDPPKHQQRSLFFVAAPVMLDQDGSCLIVELGMEPVSERNPSDWLPSYENQSTWKEMVANKANIMRRDEDTPLARLIFPE